VRNQSEKRGSGRRRGSVSTEYILVLGSSVICSGLATGAAIKSTLRAALYGTGAPTPTSSLDGRR
jgi:hypothetical protein